MKRNTVPIEDLRRLLHYDRATGVFTAKVARSNLRPGDVVGRLVAGRRQFMVCGVLLYSNRAAWAYVKGVWPADNEDVDHRDRDRTNDRFRNLRLLTRAQNVANSGLPRHNTSGAKGVGFRKRAGKWTARIRIAGRKVHLGYFDSQQAAEEAYRLAATAHFGG